MTRQKTLYAAAAVVIVAGAGGYLMHGFAATEAPAPTTDTVSAMVNTKILQKQTLQTQLDVYGDVTPGKIEGIGFPRAGQISALLVTQGQMVKRGTPLATLTSDPNTRMAYNQADSAVTYAAAELKRIQNLFALQLATQSQVDAAQKALIDQETNLQAQKKLGGDVATATIDAPFDGVVTSLAVAQGDRVQAGASVLQLGHTDELRVQLGLEPSEAGLVKAGTSLTLIPIQDEQHSLQAKVAFVQDLLDPRTQLITAVVLIPPGPDGHLVPGMKVHAKLDVGEHEAWTLPRQAVLTDNKGSYIFQVSNGTAHRVGVTTEQENGNQVAISGPVTASAPVVILGNYELQDGMKVRETHNE